MGVISVVPFYRNGQQVLLNEPQPTFQFATPGFVAPDPIDPGAGTLGAVLNFGPPPVVYPNSQSYLATPLPLVSLSAVLFDFQIVNTDINPHNVCILDPNNNVPSCMPPNCTKACEGEATIDGVQSPGHAADATYRAAVNVDSSGHVYVEMDVPPAAGSAVQVLPVVRGYLEPIKHLSSR
jgi:hypothetical protein